MPANTFASIFAWATTISQGQVVSGEWLGLGAEKLALRGSVTEKEFLALCDGLHPATGERLTLRKNSNRLKGDKVVANRRVFYDFTISPPKSVSVVALRQDDRIIDLHNRAVRLAMTELEKFAETRVRKSDQNGDRVTGNLVTACFRQAGNSIPILSARELEQARVFIAAMLADLSSPSPAPAGLSRFGGRAAWVTSPPGRSGGFSWDIFSFCRGWLITGQVGRGKTMAAQQRRADPQANAREDAAQRIHPRPQ